MITNEKVERYYNHIVGDLLLEEVMMLQNKVSAYIYEEIYTQLTTARDPSKQPTKTPDWGSGNKPMTINVEEELKNKRVPLVLGFNGVVGFLCLGFIIGVTVISLIFYFGGY